MEVPSSNEETTPTSPVKPSAVKEPGINGLVVPQPPCVFVEPMVVPSTTLVRKADKPKSLLRSKIIPFLMGIAYAVVFFFPVSFGVHRLLGGMAGLACTLGYMAGVFSVVTLFRKVEERTGISLGQLKTDKKKKKEEEEEEEKDPEALPPPVPAPPIVPQPVAVTPANPFLHDEGEQRYLRKPEAEEIAQHKKQLAYFACVLFVAAMGPLCAFFLWQSAGDPKVLAGCLIGYVVGVGYFPVCVLARAKGQWSKLFWMYKDPVVAHNKAEKKEVVEMAIQPSMKPDNNPNP